MNESACSLSEEQRFSLKSTYTFLKAATIYFEAHESIVRPEDKSHLDNLINLGVLCMARMVENFPDCAEWECGGKGDVS
jgi:hypothetical protein